MKMSEKIKSYINENGIYLKKVAEKSGMEQKKFYRKISGKTELSVEEYETICRQGLGLDPSYFFTKKFSENEKTAS